MYSKAIFTVLGAVIAGLVGYLLAWWQRRRDGRDRFLAVIGEREAELDGFRNIDERTTTFHRESFAPLRDAIFAVQPFVSASCFQRLRNLWQRYKDEDFDWKSTLEKRTAYQLQHGNDAPGEPPFAKDKLQDYMRKFRKEVD